MQTETLYTKLKTEYSGNINGAIQYCESLYLPVPSRPVAPRLLNRHNASQVKEYLEKLLQFEEESETYKQRQADYLASVNDTNGHLERFIKEEAGLFTHVPKDKQEKVWAKAWHDWDKEGYNGFYNRLVELVDLFS